MTLQEAAIKFCQQGREIGILWPDSKNPMVRKGESPKRITDPEDARQLWDAVPTANIAIYGSKKSGVILLDVDTIDDDGNFVPGLETLEKLANKWPEILDTMVVKTPHGGKTLYYLRPDWIEIGEFKNNVEIAPGITIRASGLYCAAPPSSFTCRKQEHKEKPCYGNKRFYEMENDSLPISFPPCLIDLSIEKATAPEKLYEKILRGENLERGERRRGIESYLAKFLKPAGADEEKMLDKAKEINDNYNEPLPEKELKYIVKFVIESEDLPEEKKSEERKPEEKSKQLIDIKNYYWKEKKAANGKTLKDTNGNIKYERQPFKERTKEMYMPKSLFYTYETVNKKSTLHRLENDEEINTVEQFENNLQKIGYHINFYSSGQFLTKRCYLAWIKEQVTNYTRLTCLKEIDQKTDTKYIGPEIKEDKTEAFVAFMDIFTTETKNDKYKLAASYLSGFLNSSFDGDKPIFAVVADYQRSGKTDVTQTAGKIIQGEEVIQYEVSGQNEDRVSTTNTIARKFALYDNLADLTLAQANTIARLITLKTHIGHHFKVSRDEHYNNKTYFATFNTEESLKGDLIDRAVVTRMKDSRDIKDEEREKISYKINNVSTNKILADIYYVIFNEIDWTWAKEKLNYLPCRFTIWSKTMANMLHAFWPKEKCFHFELTKYDLALDDNTENIEHALDKIYEQQDALNTIDNFDRAWISNKEIMEELREMLGRNHPKLQTPANTNKMLDKYKRSLKKYDIVGRQRKQLEKAREEGWYICPKAVKVAPVASE